MALLPITKLEAVNAMLATVGASPISVLPSDAGATALVDAVIAESVLDEISRVVQKEGWDFNSDYEYPIVPDGSNNLVPPTNTLQIELADTELSRRMTLRAGKIWDKENLTFTITETVKFNLVLGYDFAELPESLREYIKIRAARTFQDRILGSDTIHKYSQDDELLARADWESDDNLSARHSIFDDSGTAAAVRRI